MHQNIQYGVVFQLQIVFHNPSMLILLKYKANKVDCILDTKTGLILGLRPANNRRRYKESALPKQTQTLLASLIIHTQVSMFLFLIECKLAMLESLSKHKPK